MPNSLLVLNESQSPACPLSNLSMSIKSNPDVTLPPASMAETVPEVEG
jgi:hypothetical protein